MYRYRYEGVLVILTVLSVQVGLFTGGLIIRIYKKKKDVRIVNRQVGRGGGSQYRWSTDNEILVYIEQWFWIVNHKIAMDF